MFKNYLLGLYRNIAKNKFYTALNVAGLSLGIAIALFILLYVQDEISYDKHHEKYQRIYRIESDFNVNNKHDKYAIVPIPMGPALKIEFPEIEEFTRLRMFSKTLFRFNEKQYYEEDFYFADSTIFNVFTHEFVLGNPVKSLTEPFTIVLTQETAKRYFGNENPMGQIITSVLDNNYKVTGVIKDLPGNSHVKFDALISNATLVNLLGAEDYNSMKPGKFWRIGVFTYLLIEENSSIKAIHEKFPVFYEKYMKSIGDLINGSYNLMSTPLADTHFRQGLAADRPSGNKAYILIFSSAALFILLIAAINYMNMATARSANRAKEVGVKKVLGADKGRLIRQFLSESVVLSIVALVIALLIVALLLPDFNNFAGKTLSFNFFKNPVIFIEVIIITLFVGLVSGSYPAFYLSSFQPAMVLKGTVSKSGKSVGLLRKILVVFQFFIAIFMLIGTMVVSGQLRYLKNKDLGFEKENLIVMELADSAFRSKVQTFKEELLQNSNIISATNSTGFPGSINRIRIMKIEKDNSMEEQAVIYALTDYNFTETLGLEIIKGRDFDREMGTDGLEAVIINETAAKEFGWKNEAIGKKIHYRFKRDGSGGRILKVIGVVKDFNFKSLHNKIEPVIYIINEEPADYLCCRISNQNKKETLEYIELKWNEFDAKRPFDYEYLENTMDEMYKADDKISMLINITALLTIFIALLGLLGLFSFIAQQKTKEIGVRKILGASIGNILTSLYKEFILLIVIAFILVVPIAWWLFDMWLSSNFIYHQELKWYYFLLSGLLALIVGMTTISYHIIKVASGNPVDAIKHE
ncbi:MAG: hypothetical protein B6D61_01245 [Bacteroidetes bacterium 4484_249]|nr:MAG: hypothetical protein B6D61_01245 [Bacteroidetes bacterium 4484_249]